MKTGLKWGTRGRPSKQAIAERLGLTVDGQTPTTSAVILTDTRTDAEILAEMEKRFSMVAKLTHTVCSGVVRALAIAGAPGVGKSHTVHSILKSTGVRHAIVGGDISPLGLYKIAYDYRNPGDVLVFDDSDAIFTDPVSANILKHICDSSESRTVGWYKESRVLADDNIPNNFEFRGSVIFISNLDFEKIVQRGGAMAPHVDAIRDRALYVDLLLHDKKSIFVWIQHVARKSKIFHREGLTSEQGEDILQWIETNIDRIPRLSFRTINKAAQLYLTMGEVEWTDAAEVSLCNSR
jgi:hypothetical protein